jgi:hypothetical protein
MACVSLKIAQPEICEVRLVSEHQERIVGLIVGVLAAIGLAVAVTVHVLTFFPDKAIVTSDSPLFALHVGIFVVLAPLVLAQRKLFGTARPGWREQLSVFPRWAQVVIKLAVAYAVVNFALFLFTQGGTPEISGGQFVLMNHGTFIRALNEQEYNLARSHVTRGFSGHWIIFYLVPMLYFWFGKSGPQSETSRQLSSSDANN